MSQQRNLIVSRTYEKGTEIFTLYVAQISGGDIAGDVFQYEIWRNNVEEVNNRKSSGDKYEIRRIFINKLLDLHEDGFAKRKSATYSDPGFFDPGEL